MASASPCCCRAAMSTSDGSVSCWPAPGGSPERPVERRAPGRPVRAARTGPCWCCRPAVQRRPPAARTGSCRCRRSPATRAGRRPRAGSAADAARRIDPAPARRQLRPARPLLAGDAAGVVLHRARHPRDRRAARPGRLGDDRHRRAAHGVRKRGRPGPDVRGVVHVPGLDRGGRVPRRAHRRADHRRIAAWSAPRRPADHRPPGAGPGARGVLAGRRGDGDRRRRLLPHPGRDRRGPRVAG